MIDTSGQVATGRDTVYTLTIDEAAALYARAGHPRTPRSVQRYCASGHLDSIKEATTLGDKYFIEPDSVARHIAQIEELIALDNRAPSRDLSRPVATQEIPQTTGDEARHPGAPDAVTSPSVAAAHDALSSDPPVNDSPRQVATEESDTSRYVVQLEREVERANDDRDFLREQIKTKDVQIAALLERDHETNILVGSLQRMLAPLLGSPHRQQRNDDEHTPL